MWGAVIRYRDPLGRMAWRHGNPALRTGLRNHAPLALGRSWAVGVGILSPAVALETPGAFVSIRHSFTPRISRFPYASRLLAFIHYSIVWILDPSHFRLICVPKPLYAKIGLFEDKVTIDLFSLHIDLSGDLAKRIAQAQKKRK